MSKRISEVERVTAFFQNADESAANVMFLVVKGIMTAKFGKEKAPRKVRAPNKPKAAELQKDQALAAGQ